MQTPDSLLKAQIPEAVLAVLRRLQGASFRAFLVGGCVRDLLRGQVPKDYDVATSARPADVQGLFRRVIPTGIAHGTVTVLSSGVAIEVTTFRSEGGYVDGRRPTTVAFHNDVESDLSRRDFTMNAVAFDPIAGLCVDPFQGQVDLSRRLIRAVGDAGERFREDGLRALRAIRFAAVLGFDIEPATLSAIPQTLDVFRLVSMERVRDEFVKLLLSERPEKGLSLLLDQGLLSVFLPEVVSDAARRFARVARVPSELAWRLAALLLGAPTPATLTTRLKFPNALTDEVAVLCAHAPESGVASAKDAELRRTLARVGRARGRGWAALAVANGEPHDFGTRVEALLAGGAALSVAELTLDGAAVMQTLGVGPSPIVGRATRWLLDQVLEDPSRNTPGKLKDLLGQFPRN
ncbi:MAG: CCA tRNA nucleotidyltransferase [Myxococcaceae bacterium]